MRKLLLEQGGEGALNYFLGGGGWGEYFQEALYDRPIFIWKGRNFKSADAGIFSAV